MQNGHKTGFTLVELLVVIAIIAVLMGVLLPALSAARMRAQTIVCAYNLKGYGTALYMYAESNNDKAPFSFSWLYSSKTISNTGRGGCPEQCRWHYDKDKPDGTLWPYLRNIKSHMCPTFKSLAKTMTCWNIYGGHSATLPYKPTYCYSMNRWLGLYCPDIYQYPPGSAQYEALMRPEPSLPLNKVNRPAECAAFSEENMWTLENFYREGDPEGMQYYRDAIGKNDLWLYAHRGHKEWAIQNIATYHNVSPSRKNTGKANVVFVDGHVSLIRGRPGYEAYYEYGRPFRGHENFTGNFW